MAEWKIFTCLKDKVVYKSVGLTLEFDTKSKIVIIHAMNIVGKDFNMNRFIPLKVEELEFITNKAKELFNEKETTK